MMNDASRNKNEIMVLLIEAEGKIAIEFEQCIAEINSSPLLNFAIVLVTKTSLQEAHQHLEEYLVDVVFIDTNLPDAQGITGIEALLKQFPEPYIIAIARIESWFPIIMSTAKGRADCLMRHEISTESISKLTLHAYEKNQYDQEITESREIYRSLVEHLPEGVFRTDRDLNIVFCNDQFAEMIGMPSKVIIGKKHTDLFDSESAKGLRRNIAQAFEQRAWVDAELELTTYSGKTLYVQVVCGPVVDKSDEVSGIQGVIRDTSEHKKLIRQQRLSDRFEGMEAIARRVVHQVREHLAPIALNAAMIAEKTTDLEIQRLSEQIISSTTQSGQILQHVSSLGQTPTISIMEVDLKLVIDHIKNFVDLKLPKTIQFVLRAHDSLPPAKGDFGTVIEMLEILITNAREALQGEGKITLSIHFKETLHDESNHPSVVFRLEDDGLGIPKHLRSEIFDPYFTTKDAMLHPGTGLAKCMALSRRLDARLRLDYDYTSGAAFEFSLPVAAPEPKSPSTEQKGLGQIILIVDDEEAVLKTEKLFLENRGFKVITAANGAQGLSLFLERQDSLQLLITDISMPYMDGLALMKAVQEKSPDLPILVTTGTNQSDEQAKLKELGVTAVLCKPFAPRLLLEKVHEALAK